MKMKSILIGLVTLAATVAMAVPTAQITFGTGSTGNRFFEDAAFTNPTDSGWYVEIIIQNSATAYNSANYDTYLVLVEDGIGFYNPLATYHAMGYNAAGTAISTGRTTIQWQFTVNTYDNYYAAFRFYNAADKSKATMYGVSSWQQMTVDPGEPMNSQALTWGTTAYNAYIQYTLIPEPTTMALFGLGGLALVIRRKMRKDA